MENLVVVLVAARNGLNMGAVARAMSNFGAMDLRVVTPYEKAFREARSAVGAEELLKNAREFDTVAEAIADCSLVVGTTAVGNREVQHPLRSLEEAGEKIREGMEKGKVALLFGSEKWGLSNESLSYCHWLVRIPTREEHRSMNLGQAAAICLYELRRTEKKKKDVTQRARRKSTENTEKSSEKRATMETVERITEAWLGALRRSGYVAPRGDKLAEEKLRRMLRRFELEERDAEVLLGMVRKILWKLGEKLRVES